MHLEIHILGCGYKLLLTLSRFADKQLRLVRLKAARAQLEEKCMKVLERYKQKDKLVLYRKDNRSLFVN